MITYPFLEGQIMSYINSLPHQKFAKTFAAVCLIVSQLFVGCKTVDSDKSSVKTIYGNRSSWIFWSKGAFIDVVPAIHKSADGTQTKYMCAYYGESDPNFKPTNIPREDLKTVWTAYASGNNRWQSAPLDPDAVKKAIDSTPDFKNSEIGMHVGVFAVRAPFWWIASQIVTLPAATVILLFPPAAVVTSAMYVVGGVTVALVGLTEVSNYQSSRGRIGQVDDSRSPLYDPATISAADPDLDFKKLLKVLNKVPAIPPKAGIQCKRPDEILSEVKKSGDSRGALSWQAPSIKSGVKLSCANLGGRSFILDRADALNNVRLSDDVGTTISKFKWDELSSYLRRDGTIMFNMEKFQKVSQESSSSNALPGNIGGLRQYIDDNAPIQSQFDLLKNSILEDRMVVALTDLPSNGDMVDESCRFIGTKLVR
jgi:hypothetical protein